MIERTTAYLEPGSLPRLLLRKRKLLNIQSRVFSGLWNYGRVDLELVPWLAILAKEISVTDQRSIKRQSTTIVDFLYPAATLKCFKNITCFSTSRLDSRSRNTCTRRFSYSHFISSVVASKLRDGYSEYSLELKNLRQELTSLCKKLGLDGNFDVEKAWNLYGKLDEENRKKIRYTLSLYLHKSTRMVDVKKTIELFNHMDLQEKDELVYRHAARAYLQQNDLTNSMQVYSSAVKNLKIPAGCDYILGYLVDNERWPEAFSFWKIEPSLKQDFNFYRFIDKGYTRLQSALSLTSWVNSTKTSPETSPSPDHVKFALAIIGKAFARAKPGMEKQYLALLKAISTWDSISTEFYTNLINSLEKSDYNLLLLKSYRILRINKNYSLAPSALISVLRLFCSQHDVLGMKQVLDDFFLLYCKPSRAAYRMCLQEFARQGDTRTVHGLFKQYISRYRNNNHETLSRARCEVSSRSKLDKSGRSYFYEEIDEAAPLTANDFAPLLHVHAKRGESFEVEKNFDQMKTLFFIKPNILCWNIRLSSYIKNQDTDRAYVCFEEILSDHTLKPDHYTLGTMMSLFASRADLVRTRDICKMAEILEIPLSAAMLNCLVICLLRNDRFDEAEAICLESTTRDIIGSRTNMWNSLVIGYALNCDLENVNRIFTIMSEKKIEYDNYTYSALMQALVMKRQPSLAAKILFEIMPKAQVKPTSFSYAVLLGGYLATRDWKMFHWVHQRIVKSKIKRSVSTQLMIMRAANAEDAAVFKEGTVKQKIARSFNIFSETMASIDLQDITETARKGASQVPVDIMYPAMFYGFITFILGQYGEYKVALDLLDEYKAQIPERRRKAGETIKILTAMMSAKYVSHDFKGVIDCWDKALSLVLEESKPLPPLAKISLSETARDWSIPHFHQLRINEPFRIYMKTMVDQKNVGQLNQTVQNTTAVGFELDSRNWNEYVKILARNSNYYKLAFQICEAKLMPGWQEWRIQRRKLAGRRMNVPLVVRRAKCNPRSLRPYYDTMMWLTRRMIDLQARAAEDPEVQKLINFLIHECPKTIKAIEEIPRTNSDDESILKLDLSQFET